MRIKGLALWALSAVIAIGAHAQIEETDSWRLGISAGLHTSFMRISDLDKEIFPKSNELGAGVFSVFVQKAWGEELNWAIRPELAFTNRGGSLVKIMSQVPGYYEEHGYTNYKYKVAGHYFDLRVPVMYRFGDTQSRWRPYVYVAPVVGFAHGGNLSRTIIGVDGVDEMKIGASTANMAKTYFSGAFGLGADWRFNALGHACSLGVELMYELGLTDTYGKDDEASRRIPVVSGSEWAHFSDKSKRKYNGLELKLTLSVPFDIFKGRTKTEPVRYEEPAPAPAPAPEPVVEKPAPAPEPAPAPRTRCYSLEEINDMMARGESVYGKTICAIDDAITFEFDKSVIEPQSYAYLNLLAQTLIRTNARIMVKGHTDNIGSEEYNLKLSKERAMAVVEYLQRHGVPKSKLLYSYYGMGLPLADNDTEEGRAMNRRVEFEILQDK